MSKAHEYKFLYIISVSLALFLSSCVETSVQNLEASYDFHSLVKVANIASDSDVQSVTIINNSTNVEEATLNVPLGTENPAEGQPFMDFPSGSKRIIVHFGGGVPDQLFVETFDSERKYRIFIFNSDSAVVDLLKADLRYTWQQKGTEEGEHLFYPDSAFVSVMNTHLDEVISYVEISGGIDSTIDLHEAPLESGSSLPVMLPAPNNYTIALLSSLDDPDTEENERVEIANMALSTAGAGRYTAALYGQRDVVATKVFTDD